MEVIRWDGTGKLLTIDARHTVPGDMTSPVLPFPVYGCYGDSGGPMLATIDGEERVIGVLAYGPNTDKPVTEVTCGTNVIVALGPHSGLLGHAMTCGELGGDTCEWNGNGACGAWVQRRLCVTTAAPVVATAAAER